MTNDVTKQTSQEVDGFEGYVDGVEGGEEQTSNRIIQGSLLKFSNEATWETGDGEELSPDLELVAINILRVVQRWHDAKPLETRVLKPGEKFPDIDALNDAVPKKEWEEGPDGRPRGPWMSQHITYLLDPRTMGKYTFPTGTVGGAIATRDLVDRTQWMRRFKGVHVYAVVKLSDVFMRTRFGGRQRPHFNIVRWVSLDGGGALLTPTELPALESPPTAPTEVKPPSAKEVTDDEIKF